MEFVRFAEIAIFFCLNLRDTVIKNMTAAHPAMTNREEGRRCSMKTVPYSPLPRRYCLGVRLFEYGCAVSASWSVSDLAKPHLQHLASVTGPSVFLSMLNRSEVITIEQVQSRAGLRVVSEVGTRLPLHCTSQGKVFLSAMADHEAKRVLSRRTLEPYTPKALVTWEELFRVMQAARENGYAVEEGEYRFGLCLPSAPVRDSSGAVRYAVGVVGMFDSVRSPDFQRDIDLTCAAAAQISTALGYRA